MRVQDEDGKVAATGRRRFLFTASLAGAALGARPAAATPGFPGGHDDGPAKYVIDDTSAVGETESGKVVGYIRNGIRIFKGIPYAEIHAPENRWLRASKTRPWAGKRSCRAPGPVCPPVSPSSNEEPADEVLFHNAGSNISRPGEDCLRINICTPGLDNKKRRVLFWIHGAGMRAGSSLMASHYEGENLARHGDVVVVSINHRLNVFGFLDLAAYGSRWAESANLGMLDAVDALKWVRGNISNFGGDPTKIMIFGQSGGGWKVATLLAMPEAKGLFDRAVIQSGVSFRQATPEQAAARTAAFLKLVDVSPHNLDALYKLPVEKLTAAAARLETQTRNAWRPVVDGRTVTYEPLEPNSPSSIPLLLGTTLHESNSALGHPEYDEMSEPKARELVRGDLGVFGDQVYEVYKAAFPHMKPFDLSAVARAAPQRANAIKLAQLRSTFHMAPTFLYWFQWQPKILGGRPKSHHALDNPFVFMNSDHATEFTGGTAEARALQMKIGDAWLAFARTGDPNHKALPRWAPVTPQNAPAMVFDVQCRIDQVSDAAAIELIRNSRHPNS